MDDALPPPTDLKTIDTFGYFRQQLDQKIAAAWQQYHTQMVCKAGCFQCCRRDFQISRLEADLVRWAVTQLPDAVQAQVLQQAQNNQFPQCPLLVDGQCSVYEQRPILCRLFGFPLFDGQAINTCELNFVDHQGQDFTAHAFDLTAIRQIINQLNTIYRAEVQALLAQGGSDPTLPVESATITDWLIVAQNGSLLTKESV